MIDKAIREVIRSGINRDIHTLDMSSLRPQTIRESDVADSYAVGEADVFITTDGRYVVSEPEVSDELNRIIQTLAGHLYMSIDTVGIDGEITADDISNYVWKAAAALEMSDMVARYSREINYYVRRNTLGYWKLDVLFKDDNIEDIMIPARTDVGVVLRKNKARPIYRTNILLGSEAEFSSLVTRILEKCDAHASNAAPIADAITPEGDRVSVAFRREVSQGTAMNVRKFSRTPLTVVDLLRSNMLTPTMAAYWWMLVDAMSFNLIVGVTSSGKTTLANALLAMSNPDWMLVTVEDTPEMRLPHRHLLSLKTRTSIMNKDLTFDIEDLIPVTLRHNPHLVIVGEARSRAAIYAAFENAAAGHGGVTTIHAPNAKKTIERIRFAGVDDNYLSLLWTVWHCREIRSPKRDRIVRRVIEVDEVRVTPGEPLLMNAIFAYDSAEDEFTDYSPRELVSKSDKIRDAAETLGLRNPVTDIERRVEILDACVREGMRSQDDITRAAARYYCA